MNKIIGLRIDVDTKRGYKNGVVPLLDLLKKYNINATFFIVAGYESPFKTFPRLFNERGFSRRLFRLKGGLCYKIFSQGSLTFGQIIRLIKDEGHEIGLHGYHHFDWQIHLDRWSKIRINCELSRAVESFKQYTGSHPCSFAAPGWVTNENVFFAEEKFHFNYCSDTRGVYPFYPFIDNLIVKTIQIPVTLPTLDELISLGNVKQLIEINVKSCDVYCAHAEFDGMKYIGIFESFLEKHLRNGYRFVTLSEIKKYVSDVPSTRVVYKTIPGRTNVIACQRMEKG